MHDHLWFSPHIFFFKCHYVHYNIYNNKEVCVCPIVDLIILGGDSKFMFHNDLHVQVKTKSSSSRMMFHQAWLFFSCSSNFEFITNSLRKCFMMELLYFAPICFANCTPFIDFVTDTLFHWCLLYCLGNLTQCTEICGIL